MSREGTWTLHTTIHSEADAAATWTNMPAADTFLFGSHRHVVVVDVGGFQQVRLKVNKQGTAGNPGATLRLCWAPSFSTTVGSYADIGVTQVSVAVDTTNTFLDSGWIDMSGDVVVEGDDVYLAVIGNGGNGVLDPQFGNISVSFK